MSQENVELARQSFDAVNRRETWFDALPDSTIDVELRDRGDPTFAALRAHGHGAGSDLPFEDTVWHATRWRSRASSSTEPGLRCGYRTRGHARLLG